MDPDPDIPGHYPSLGERIADAWDRGLRVARRLAIAFGLSTALAIGLGALVTDNAFSQIVVTMLAAIGFWIPMLIATVRVERFLERRRARKAAEANGSSPAQAGQHHASWARLAAAAPAERERLRALQRSLATSRQSLGDATMDPDAHDLCVLIDRRLPDLIDRELDSLPPDDRGRRQRLGELVGLVEQFARHCSRKRDGDLSASAYEAEILRRRFETRLMGAGPLDQ